MKFRKKFTKPLLLIVAMATVAAVAVGGTVAWLQIGTDAAENAFVPGEVTGEIHETFNGSTKSNVYVENKSNIPVYVRVALVPTWVDKDGNILPQSASEANLNFALGSGWFKSDGYYYHKSVVAANGQTANLADKITVTGAPDGAHMDLQILSEVIQADPADAVKEAWGVTPGADGTLS
ncbi:hypothetical protein [Intestinibacillus massiliensis]|uniref:hypothetical protein n=1 Tax=Intestinibacillus massiliensis TaxID=1871029 RepID=UPI000B34B4DC|nr:hypothetical protein [Intestinibacillus massiliensis]